MSFQFITPDWTNILSIYLIGSVQMWSVWRTMRINGDVFFKAARVKAPLSIQFSFTTQSRSR